MKAVRLHPASPSSPTYSPSNPAPASALQLDDIPIPQPLGQGDILIRVKATTVVRDALTWPESYTAPYAILGWDFAGVVEQMGPASTSNLRPGDEVFGMASGDRAGTWAEYTVVKEHELALKPKNLSWEEAAALPMSALTAYEALFDHAGISIPTGAASEQSSKTRVLITGAAGAVGLHLVQLAALAGVHIVAASSSNARNGDVLTSLGADEVAEYPSLRADGEPFDVIIDTVGGDTLKMCWSLIRDAGTLVTIDSASYGFVEEHKKAGLTLGKDQVKALFFIVSVRAESLEALARWAGAQRLKSFVAASYPLSKVSEAYELGDKRQPRRGKIVLTI